jgi:hypothetical protein
MALNKNRQDVKIGEFFILQLDEWTNVCSVSQLLVFIWIVFSKGKLQKTIAYFKTFILRFWK